MRARLLALAAAASVVALAGFAGAADAHPGRASGTSGGDAGGTQVTTVASGGSATRHAATRTDQRSVSQDADPASQCSDADTKPYGTGLPLVPCVPNLANHLNRFVDYGAPIQPTTQKVIKPKVTIQIPPIKVRAFDIVCLDPAPPILASCPVHLDFPKLDTSVTAGYYGTYAEAWVASPGGTQPQFGVFPTLSVKMLAFGAIPVSAKVHIAQPVKNGISTPLALSWLQTSTPVPQGKTIPGNSQYGPSPGNGYFWSPPALLSGPIVISLSDVRVDKVKLPVGSACQTSTTLKLGAPGGFYLGGSKPVRGKPGGWAPLYNGASYLDGLVNIPAFTGCHHGAENLDPLITGMVSGPGNPIAATQAYGLTNYGCLIHPTDPNCSSEHPSLAKAARSALGSSTVSALHGRGSVTAAQLKGIPVRVRRILEARGLLSSD